MKRLFTLLFFSVVISANAQIINGGFESWVQNGQNCMGPESWGTINGSTGIVGVCTVEEETSDVHGGNSALKLSTKQVVIPPVIDEIAPGICTNGTVNTQTEAVEGGDAFTAQPAAFTGWYKAAPVNQDEYSFSALLINETSGDTVGYADWSDTATVSAYTQFTAPITYTSTQAPTLLQITLLPSSPGNPQIGTVVWFDDIEAEGNVANVSENNLTNISVYPNPSAERLYFKLVDKQPMNIQIFNLLGLRVLDRAHVSDWQDGIDISNLPNGTYIWKVSSSMGEITKTGKFVVLH